MKQIIWCVIILLTGAQSIVAQRLMPQIGVHGFVGISSLYIYDGLYGDNTIGITTGAGATVEFPVSKRLAIETGVRYNYLRGSYDHPETNNRETVFHHKNSGFSVPVSFKVYVNDNREKVFFQTGFTPMYGIRNEVIVFSVQDGSDYSRNQDITDRYGFRKRDLFGQIGIGYNIPLSKKWVLSLLPYFSMNVPGGLRNAIQHDNQWADYPVFNNRQWCLQASLRMTNDE